LLRAASDLGLDLGRSTLVGDKGSDLVAAHAVGARSVLVLTGYGLGEWEYRRCALPVRPDHVAEDLLAAADWAIEGLAR
jgi:D-glycero-D-manno-heptose 1,7-bisphosphate phosphatase